MSVRFYIVEGRPLGIEELDNYQMQQVKDFLTKDIFRRRGDEYIAYSAAHVPNGNA